MLQSVAVANSEPGFEYHPFDDPTKSMKIVLMMYDGAIGYLRRAMIYAEMGDSKNHNILVNKTRDVIAELNGGLDEAIGGDFAIKLRQLYNFMREHLASSIHTQNKQAIEDVIKILSSIRDSWQEVEKQFAV